TCGRSSSSPSIGPTCPSSPPTPSFPAKTRSAPSARIPAASACARASGSAASSFASWTRVARSAPIASAWRSVGCTSSPPQLRPPRGPPGLLQEGRRLRGVLVVGRDDPLRAGQVGALPVGGDFDLGFGVGNALDADEDLHGVTCGRNRSEALVPPNPKELL